MSARKDGPHESQSHAAGNAFSEIFKILLRESQTMTAGLAASNSLKVSGG